MQCQKESNLLKQFLIETCKQFQILSENLDCLCKFIPAKEMKFNSSYYKKGNQEIKRIGFLIKRRGKGTCQGLQGTSACGSQRKSSWNNDSHQP